MTRARAAGDALRAPYEEAVAAIRAGRAAPVYLLSGPSHLAASAVRESLLEAHVEPGRRELDAPVIPGATLSWAGLLDLLRTPSWSGGHRVVTVDEPPGFAPGRKGRGGEAAEADHAREGDGADARDAGDAADGPAEDAGAGPFEAYLDAPQPDVTVVVRVRAPVDRRRRIVKRIERLGGFVDCRQPGERLARRAALAEAKAWLVRRAAAAGRRFAPGVAARVVAQAGPDLDLLDRELEKMILHADGGVIGPEALAIVTGDADEDIFVLVDAIGERDAARVHAELARLWERGESPLGVLALLANQVRIMRAGTDLARSGRRPADIASALGANPYRVERALDQARRFTAAELDRALENAWLAEWRVKSGQWPEREALEWTVATLVGSGADRPTRCSSRSFGRSGPSSSSARRRPGQPAPS